jgi:hypothetical protein
MIIILIGSLQIMEMRKQIKYETADKIIRYHNLTDCNQRLKKNYLSIEKLLIK